MLILHWSLNVVGALLMATSDQQAQDARGVNFRSDGCDCFSGHCDL